MYLSVGMLHCIVLSILLAPSSEWLGSDGPGLPLSAPSLAVTSLQVTQAGVSPPQCLTHDEPQQGPDEAPLLLAQVRVVPGHL